MLIKNKSIGFLNRLVFTKGLFNGMQLTSLSNLNINQFQKVKIRDETAWKITASIGDFNKSAETDGSGWNAVGHKPVEVCVRVECYENVAINFFQGIGEYMTVSRSQVHNGSRRFFLPFVTN